MGEVTNLDHDLLIELRTEMKNVRADIKDLKDGTSDKIKALETRTEELESRTGNFKVAFTLYSIAVAFMISLIIYHIAKQ